MKRVEQVYETVKKLQDQDSEGVTAQEVSRALKTDRSNVSRYLNILVDDQRLVKTEGRPVKFKLGQASCHLQAYQDSFDKMIGANLSLQIPTQQAKAAIFYPPHGLHTLLLGETGVGKSMFAERMYEFAIEVKMIEETAPFVHFNCADYASNPQLLVAQIFGVKKGAYTGADQDRDGLLLKADQGILFLDEVHRLSPEGQEMLFTFIDKGYFRPLGESERTQSAQVQIIAATTEDPSSFLLKTFTRRIPMTISLPALSDRLIEERYQLIQMFINAESKRVNKSIYINKNSLISLLLYECVNNIGQLKSDIQLACAKAFLKFMSNEENYILIAQIDLPHHVKRGLMRIKENRDEVDKLLKHKGDILRFHYDDTSDPEGPSLYSQDEPHFYSKIEEKINSLKDQGLADGEINELLNIDIDAYFNKFIGNLPSTLKREEVKGVVAQDVAEIVDDILTYAGNQLNRTYDDKLFFGLALHLSASIERIKDGKKIFHPKLNVIRVQHEKEFMVAMEVAKFIDSRFNIQVPLDEIGYITLFLSSQVQQDIMNEEGVYVIVVAHGKSTASSMVQVAKSLVQADRVIGLDMPLSIKAEDMYDLVKEEVLKLKQYDGIILLVDMGSLCNFGDMIYEETGIAIKTIDMVSTPIVLEACRKASLGRDLQEIYKSCRGMQQKNRRRKTKAKHDKTGLILTACFTGEGASEKLKQVIEDQVQGSDQVMVASINILNRKEYLQKIEDYRKDYRLLAIVGTIDIDITGIPFISAVDIFAGSGIQAIQDIISTEAGYQNIVKSLKEHISVTNVDRLVHNLRHFIDDVCIELRVEILVEVKTGILLHLAFLLEKLIKEEAETAFKNLDQFKNRYSREMVQLRNCLTSLEDTYQVHVGEDELAYICKMFVNNDASV